MTHPLREIIDDAKEDSGLTLDELTVLGKSRDPYRLDTKAMHRNARWVKQHVDRFRPGGRQMHLRGLHYLLISAGGVLKPDGSPYVNTKEDYFWLNDAAAAARWLGYVPFWQIVDNRNEAPTVREPVDPTTPKPVLGQGAMVYLPDTADLLPRFECDDFPVVQPYRLVLMGEKSSLHAELDPIAEEYGAELILATGENSLTLVHDMLRRAAKDGRPVRCFYVSDFDPSGIQMPISTARKIQGMRDMFFPDLELRLYKVALTEDQVIQYDLPPTPMKAKEMRAGKFRDAFGRDATEIDALIALRPGTIERLAREAMDPFFDSGLADNVEQAQSEWQDEADALIDDHDDHDEWVEMLAADRAKVAEAIERLDNTRATIREMIAKLTPPAIELPEPETDGDEYEDGFVFSTDEGYADATERMRDIRAYEN